ncbi:hypothetical protein FS837_001366 [Tulasnella sp. UAMH 9824]|nr:hypothetical protein FS837_001366 [Tulasnella sp. UAMH 9824]
MASGLGELEALLATPHSAFLSSSSAIDPPESTRQYLNVAFRETFTSRSALSTPASHTEAYVPTRDPVREGTSQIQELIQSVADLKNEVKNLRSALAASEPVTSNEAHLKSQPSSVNATDRRTNVTPEGAAQGNSSSEGHSGIASSLSLSTGAILGPKRPAPKAKKAAGLPRVPSQSTSLTPSPITVSIPAETPNPQAASSTIEKPVPTSPNAISKSCTCQAINRLAKEGSSRTQKCSTCSLNDGGQVEAGDAEDSGNFEDKETKPKAPIIATAVKYFSAYNEGEIDLRPKDRITILDSPDTPVDWMYGEVVETRRGIFPAQHVRELPRPNTKERLNDDSDIEDSEATELPPKTPIIVTAVSSFQASKRGELSLHPQDAITILTSPDTPFGWKYGEIVKTRRGIFPARYVTLDNA